ncbi:MULTISPECIES: DUF2157 domain-containing protein [unclassified Shewanella]|uniref:DUF2157 domain-containing protein n=1 Tax=unclassified Shewanella TaxID=196818 RepID=UPI001BC48785|nr:MULTISPECIES: DUF2157 domain-containing protein [unclassified Shewanella]GIU07752.1 hypothetical protein TUM4444_07680 [Shewanella sp. MBTL60-112-B1]GIU30385.1 hypothetical protein TUM4445_13670 [Shewanella sp. MBTL60-112-B2]
MNNLKTAVWHWFKQEKITQESLPAALTCVSEGGENHPTAIQWRALSDLLLSWLAALLLGSGLVFFVAANWQTMSQFARFALVEAAIIFTLLTYVFIRWREFNNGEQFGFGYTSANAVLLLLAIMIGSLLALVGQTYQTGADPWQLFALWALFTLPLALIAGSELLWLLLALLLNLATVLYYQTFPGFLGRLFLFDHALEALFMLNLLLHASSLVLSGKLSLPLGLSPGLSSNNHQRFAAPLLQQLTILIVVISATLLAIEEIFDWHSGVWLWIYSAFIAVGYWLYNLKLKQIFVLAIGGFSLVAVFNSLLTRAVLEGTEPIGLLLLLGLCIIASTSMLTLWLRQRHRVFSKGEH